MCWSQVCFVFYNKCLQDSLILKLHKFVKKKVGSRLSFGHLINVQNVIYGTKL